MLRVFETFSGVGSQAKALRNTGIDHEIIATADWDVSAIIAYDLIHNGQYDLTILEGYTDKDIDDQLDQYSLSLTGKLPSTKKSVRHMNNELKRLLLSAIIRSNNMVNMTIIKGSDVPNDIDLLTYSFPCQDLSLCKFWHGDVRGIDRNAQSRSGMLWEVERILQEMYEAGRQLPRFLLMENVSAILNTLNKKNFNEWKSILEGLGYVNIIYRLNAKDFGIPQNRERAYMISVRHDGDIKKSNEISEFFNELNNIQLPIFTQQAMRRDIRLKDILKLDYNIPAYRIEADESQPNDTESRRRIYETNVHLLDEHGYPLDIVVNTVTTKQDRHPNSGVIDYNCKSNGASFRYLTPRECFLLMGFDEADYQILVDNNVPKNKRSMLFSRDKLIKLAGNSIVVDVLECLFKLIDKANRTIMEREEVAGNG